MYRQIRQYCYNNNPVAKGSYGTVYKGIHQKTRRPVAIKISRYLKKARKEAYVLRKYGRHRYLPRFYDFFIQNGRAYLVMEWVRGAPLARRKRWLWIGKKRSLKQSVVITMRLLQTIRYLNSKGIVHRDVKPDNVMLGPRFLKIKLIDLGSARKYRRIRHNPDIVRCAFVLLFLLKGKVRADTLIRKKQYPPFTVRPLTLQRVLRKALHPKRRWRYHRADDLIRVLRRYVK